MKKSTISLLLLSLTSLSTIFAQPRPEDRAPIFPLLGKEAREKGFDLPKAIGFTASYYHQNSNIGIPKLGVGTDASNLTFYGQENIDVNSCNAIINSFTFRPDVWLFPFLNVYGIIGKADVNTQVDVKFGDPVPIFPISSNVDSDGFVYGVGAQMAVKIKGLWANADINHGWSAIKILDEPAQATNLSFRLGNIIDLSPQTKLNLWVGAASQYFQNDNFGAIPLKHAAINPETGQPDEQIAFVALARMSGIEVPSAEFQQFVQDYKATGKNILEDNITYLIQKELLQPWNLNLGAQLEIKKRFQVRAEYGFLGDRTTFLTSVTYRFDL